MNQQALQEGETAAATDEAVSILREDPLSFDYGDLFATVHKEKIYPLGRDGAAHHLGGSIIFMQ